MPTTPAPDEADELLRDGAVSVAGAAEFCGVSESELWRAMAAGEIEFFCHKSGRLIARVELRRWLKAKYVATRHRGRKTTGRTEQ